MSYLVGTRLSVTLAVTDKLSAALVDPGTLLLTLLPPSDSAIATGTYAWNGTIWTASEAVIAAASRVSVGTFALRITLPYVNTAAGRWCLGWKSTANAGVLGEGSGEVVFLVDRTQALP